MKAFFAGWIVLGMQVLTLGAAGKDEAKPSFADKFDAKLAKDRSWLREDPKAWRIAKDGLET
jgi:hypothetical protein